MFGTHDLLFFIFSGWLLNLIPGADSLYIIGRGASQGLRAGSIAAFGIGTGIFMHIMAAALGLSAILATSAAAFTILKLIGVAYLMYMGITMLLTSKVANETQMVEIEKNVSLRKVYTQGILTNILNPKIALFFLAFVPQFINADAPNKALAFIFLGSIFTINGMIWCNFLAWASAKSSNLLKKNKMLTRYLQKSAGLLFIYFGLKMAFED